MQIRTLHLATYFQLWVIKLLVSHEELSLQERYKLKCYHERDGHEVCGEDSPRAELLERVEDAG